LMQLAIKTKTPFLMLQGLRSLEIEVPDQIQERLRELQQLCFHQNMSSVASNVRIARILKTHGIESLSVKGVLRSHEVYGRWDIRSAADIDILVRHKDYRQAGEVLLRNGYWAPVSEKSVWWHHYLGEAPYLPDSANGPIVDLHHKLNQPGTPALKDTDAVFDSSVVRSFGEHELRVIEPRAALMLAATSFGKALRQHEPCLTNLHEIAYVRASRPDLTDESLDQFAKSHNLLRLWHHARETADALFRPSVGNSSRDDVGFVIQDLAVPTWPQRLLHRTRLLWNWTDGGAARPLHFAREFGRVRAAMLSHSAYEKQARINAA
ncbi:MAG: nucleotidyltransferase family protein, partial [Pseudomonadota bacterium]